MSDAQAVLEARLDALGREGRTDSVGRCRMCGYEGPGPSHDCSAAPDGTVDPAPRAKRRKRVSPTALTLAECRRRGWEAGVVEKPWNPHTKRTLDLFGVIDLIAIVPAVVTPWEHVAGLGDVPGEYKPGAILAIQTTGGNSGNHASRRTKILAEPRARLWVEAGGRLELWSWRQPGGKGSRWVLRVQRFVVIADEGLIAAAEHPE